MTLTATRTAIAATLATALLAGCASLAPATPEAAVQERATARWQALIKGDYERAYKLSTPSYRAKSNLARYRGQFGSAVSWEGISVPSVKCEVEKCVATVLIKAKPVSRARQIGTLETAVEEVWVQEDGQWWFSP